MRKSLLLTTFVLTCFSFLHAGIVSIDDARNIAINFFKVNAPQARGGAGLSAQLYYTRTEADNTPDFYVFNMSPAKGFVIVAADDIIRPVIAYSIESYFDANLHETGVVDWMKHAGQHVAHMRQLHVAANTTVASQWSAYRAGVDPITEKSAGVGPLTKTIWNQEPGYNAFCPFNSTDNQRCVTGCVATSMAQIMKFWNFPAHGLSSNSYTAYNFQYNVNYGNLSANFDSTNYDWAGMFNVIGANDTPIATLMYQCGVGVDMDYGDDHEDGSGAEVLLTDAGGGPCAQNAFAQYFSYNPNTMQGYYESDYNDSASWYNLVTSELNAGRPLMYVGEDPSAGGHAWVCDGYDANNLLHMNWGWGGIANGYYAASDLSAGGYNFSNQEEILIGIEPLGTSVRVTPDSLQLCAGQSTTLTAVANADSYNWSPTTGLSCPTCATTQASPTSDITYTLVVDSAGYQGVALVAIRVRQGPSVSNGNVVNATCNGIPNGSAAVSASGGTPGYTYLWSNGCKAAIDTNLNPGVYYVTAYDAAGCPATTIQVVGSDTPAIVITPTTTTAGCKASNGSATVSVSGGPGGTFVYTWTNGSTGDEINDVAAGTYGLTVSEGACSASSSITVDQQDQLNAVITTDASNGQNGSATVETVTGGNSPFSYDWITLGNTSQSVSGLAPGIYPVVITDANGCFDTVTAVVGVATGITPVNNALSVSLYPNPSKGQLMLQLNQIVAGTYLKLENMLGQTLVNKPVTELLSSLDLSSFANGVYLLEVGNGDKRVVKQVVLNR